MASYGSTRSNIGERAGVSPLSSAYTGIVRCSDASGAFKPGPEAGPIDWTGNGIIDPLAASPGPFHATLSGCQRRPRLMMRWMTVS